VGKERATPMPLRLEDIKTAREGKYVRATAKLVVEVEFDPESGVFRLYGPDDVWFHEGTVDDLDMVTRSLLRSAGEG